MRESPELLESALYGEPLTAPRVSLWEAVRRWWPGVLILGLLFLAVGLFVGFQRDPEYTAEARLTVGRLDVDPASLATFASATQSLASAYSRAVDAEPVVRRVARRVGMEPNDVRAHVKASPVPESPVIRVTATGASEEAVIRLANATSRALVDYTSTLNRSSEDSRRLLVEYRRASREVARAQAFRDRLGQSAVGSERSRALEEADAQVDTARLRANSLASAFESSQQGRGSSKLVDVLTGAVGASSDRTSKVQLLGLLGLVAGLLLGVAIAGLRANRHVRSSMLS